MFSTKGPWARLQAQLGGCLRALEGREHTPFVLAVTGCRDWNRAKARGVKTGRDSGEAEESRSDPAAVRSQPGRDRLSPLGKPLRHLEQME